ncbi:MAG: ethanolamine ammonia-lyase subunit EutB [Planctomycetes bacterium]|nr:ethanolamine ammonia-lyase subunit EutB [Planctomycetota bacterium]
MVLACTLRSTRHVFADLKDLLAKAGEAKSGDTLAGIAASSETERVAAKMVLADLQLADFIASPLIDPDTDEVSRLIHNDHDAIAFASMRSQTVGELREWLLEDTTDGAAISRVRPGLTPEMIAAVVKLMANKELVLVASKIRIVTKCRNTMGGNGILGVRIQPNHPADDLQGILASTIDGLLLGCGDAVIGVNPATDDPGVVGTILHGLDQLIDGLQIPTQHCCLAHITTQMSALEQGAPVDLLFQSVAGTQAANASFGINLALIREGQQQVLEARARRNVRWIGKQCTYFETGQGSALSAEAHHGVDQLTIEARAQAVARAFDPFLVNSVVGFIGPEYLADERQIVRAGLEDHCVGKLLGLPMGVDVCHTNHADADQNSLDNLLLLLAAAGVNFVMGVPCGDDVMLNYQSTSPHDAALARQLFGLLPAPEFAQWLEEKGLFHAGRLASTGRPALLDKAGRLLKGY